MFHLTIIITICTHLDVFIKLFFTDIQKYHWYNVVQELNYTRVYKNWLFADNIIKNDS